MFGLFQRNPPPLPTIESDRALVLPAKGRKHYHVTGLTYESVARNGVTLNWSAAFDLIGNDVLVVAERARQIAHRRYVHVNGFRECSEAHPE